MNELLHSEHYLAHDIEIRRGIPKKKQLKVCIRRMGRLVAVNLIYTKRKNGYLREEEIDHARKMVRTYLYSERVRLQDEIKELEWDRADKVTQKFVFKGIDISIIQDLKSGRVAYEVDPSMSGGGEQECMGTYDQCVKQAKDVARMIDSHNRGVLQRTIWEIEKERREKDN